MATLQDYRNERLRKLQELQDLGVPAYPARCERTHRCAQISAEFSQLEGQTVTVVGRVTALRKFGKLARCNYSCMAPAWPSSTLRAVSWG